MNRIIGLAAIVVALSITGATALASPGPVGGSNAKPCKTSGTALVNVQYTLTNDLDSGVAGNDWATDTISRQLQIWQVDSNTFCVSVSDQGSFVTIAGASPQDTGNVTDGITGKMKGGYSGPVTGTPASSPAYAASGNLGTFDANSAHPTYLSYISAVTSDNAFDVWGWSYHASQNGTWTNTSSGNTGDITG
jgi:hypothetical protein